MGELNERYADVVEQLDGWIKSYIKEICSGFEPNVMKLYVENTFEDLSAESGFEKYNMGYISSEMKWGFFVNKSVKKESLITLIDIFLEILKEKIPSSVALDEVSNILDYLRKGSRDLYLYKERFFEKIFRRKTDSGLCEQSDVRASGQRDIYPAVSTELRKQSNTYTSCF